MPFEPQHQTIVECAWVIDAIGIADQGIGHATEIEQAIPVGVVAGQAGDLEAEHDADPAHGHFGGHAGEAIAVAGAGAREAEIVVDHGDLLAWPNPSSRACSTRAYCRSVDSRWHSTWAMVDWRT